jgi:hypothetical protein
MMKVKEMPYSEKYAKIVDELKLENSSTFAFIQKSLGNQALVELNKLQQEVLKPVPEDASDKQKYEIAYGNWVLSGGVIFKFVRSKLGEDGIERHIRVSVDAWKRENASPAIYLLSFIRFFSPSSAFSMIVKNSAYQTQWLGTSTISALSKSRAVVDIPHCSILDYPGGEDVCLIGCQKIFPIAFAEQFKVNMKFNRQGKSCVETLTPVK